MFNLFYSLLKKVSPIQNWTKDIFRDLPYKYVFNLHRTLIIGTILGSSQSKDKTAQNSSEGYGGSSYGF